MSNQTTYDQDDDDDVEEPQNQQEPNLVKQLRGQLKEATKRAKQADELQTKLTSIERKSAFQDAGLTLNDKQRQALEAIHQGDWSADAVRQTAVEMGWAQPTEQQQEVSKAISGQERIAQAVQGSSATPPASEALIESIKSASNEAEILALLQTAGRPTTYDLQ